MPHFDDGDWMNDEPHQQRKDKLSEKETRLGPIDYPRSPSPESFAEDDNLELSNWIIDTFDNTGNAANQIGVSVKTLNRAMDNKIISPWSWGKIRQAGYRGYLRGLLG